MNHLTENVPSSKRQSSRRIIILKVFVFLFVLSPCTLIWPNFEALKSGNFPFSKKPSKGKIFVA